MKFSEFMKLWEAKAHTLFERKGTRRNVRSWRRTFSQLALKAFGESEEESIFRFATVLLKDKAATDPDVLTAWMMFATDLAGIYMGNLNWNPDEINGYIEEMAGTHDGYLLYDEVTKAVA
jgi:hypothetical protein